MIRCEPFAPCREAALELGRAHWREFYGSEHFPGDPDAVEAMNADGRLIYFTARDEDGALVGHGAWMVFETPLQACKAAMDLFYYVVPERRREGLASDLLNFAGRHMVEAGIPVVLASHMVGADLASTLVEAGFRPASLVYHFAEA